MAENVDLTASVISALISTSNGDLRRAITYLQSAQRLSAASKPPLPITARDIQEIAGTVPDDVVLRFAGAMGVESEHAMDVDAPKTGSKRQLTEFEKVREEVKTLMREGYSATQILSQVRIYATNELVVLVNDDLVQLHDLIIPHPTLTSRQKSDCAMVFAEADKALCDGADEELWVLEVGLKVSKALAR